jgi:hypothetical protein
MLHYYNIQTEQCTKQAFRQQDWKPSNWHFHQKLLDGLNQLIPGHLRWLSYQRLTTFTENSWCVAAEVSPSVLGCIDARMLDCHPLRVGVMGSPYGVWPALPPWPTKWNIYLTNVCQQEQASNSDKASKRAKQTQMGCNIQGKLNPVWENSLVSFSNQMFSPRSVGSGFRPLWVLL